MTCLESRKGPQLPRKINLNLQLTSIRMWIYFETEWLFNYSELNELFWKKKKFLEISQKIYY